MALSEEYQKKSLENFIKRYNKKLTAQSKILLDAVNKLAASYDVPLGFQSDDVIELVGKQLAKPFDASSLQNVAASIYSMVIEQNDREKNINMSKHHAQGRFDLKYIHQRSLRDQLQDHDMSLLMPKSHNNIEVLGPVNRFDSGSIEAAQEGLNLALKNKHFDHIFIPIGPGHWRGFYLTKPVGGKGKYHLELFDPFGPSGADAIKDIALDLLKECGIDKSQITIETTGPTHPQRDMYACGDFTCAYSHKKMKALGAPNSVYNQDLITILDSRGNKGDSLRYASREISSRLATFQTIVQPEEEVEFSEVEKREFLIRLGQIVSDPNKMDQAVLEGNVAQIKNTFGTYKSASLRELDAYGVFNSDGSINKDIAAKYEIKFNENEIKTRLKSYGFKHLSVREMIIFESAIRSVINDLTSAAMDRDDEYISSNQPSMGLAKQCFAEFLPPTLFRLVNPLSMELTGPTRQMIGMGYFKFKDTNVSISPGPSSAKSLTPETNPELYEAEQDIARYLNNLLTNNVTHVFAMGRVFPYYPQADSGQREIRKDEALNDFINYFIPDANGRVTLPDIPELENIHITSRPVRKVGRFITYEISINGSAPIQVHHFPLRDKQPLELTLQELAHVQKVGQKTPPEQNIHAHCRKGKGRSAQIAYLLASLNPKYSQLNSEERLAQMRAEKTPKGKPGHFIETDLQKDYIEEAGYLIQEHIGPEAFLEEDIECYIVYGTLLKQEIDRLLQQIEIPKQISAETEQAALLELIEKYQELNSTPPHQLPKWVKDVCKNPLISEPTLTLFGSIKNSTDFLLHGFAEQRNLDELAVFFDLQTHTGNYQDILDKLEGILPEHVQMEQDQFDNYKSSFKVRVQNAYLKNSRNLSNPNKIQLKLDVLNNILETGDKILDAIINHDPEKFTKAEFNNLKEKYYQWKQCIELLKKAEIDNDYKVLDKEVEQRINVIEQFFLLDYDHLTVDPVHITGKMHLIHEELSELIATNELSPRQWMTLKKQFTAFKIIFDFTKPDEMETPDIFSTLDKLFKEKREHVAHLSILLKWEVLQVESKKESLEEFVTGIILVVLNTLLKDFPKEYYSDDSIYSKKIDLLLEDVSKLAATKKPKKGEVRETPRQEDYAEARQQVIDLIEERLPFLITSTDFRVRFENLVKDFMRLKNGSQLRGPEFEVLKNRFAELKSEYQKQDKNEFIEHVISAIEAEIQTETVDSDSDSEQENSLTKQYQESRENVLRIKAIRSAAAREAQDEIPFFESRIEQKKPKEMGYPKRPKLIVFNIDDVLIELNHGEMTRTQELINVLNYAKKYSMEVTLACSHTPPDNEEQSPFAQLKTIIEKNAKMDISHMVFFLDTLPLHHEKATTSRHFQRKSAQLEEQINLLKSQIPTEEDLDELATRFPAEKDRDELEKETKKLQTKKEKLEEKIKKLQAEIESIPEKAAKLTSDKFIHLDAIKHHHALRKPSNDVDYYQAVEGGILKDFKNPELFGEMPGVWNDLFQLAEVIMETEYPQLPSAKPSTARPSLQTLLKELIFNADKPKLLQKKYGDLHQWEEARQKIQDNKELFLQHIPQIEAFYQHRLAYQKRIYEKGIYKKAVLNEEDIVVFDSHQDIINQIYQRSNYRTIKIDNGRKNPLRHIVELNYEMGAYNGVIAYLKGDGENAPKNYGPGCINKTLASYLTSIPDFRLSEFQHSPIVLHVEMSAILAKLPELSTEKEIQQRYKEQFFAAAIERFEQLPKASQDDFVKTYYRNVHQALKEINQELAKLISSHSSQHDDKLTELQLQADKIIEMDEQFSQYISPTFLSSEAKLLRAMITQGLESENLDHLKVDVDKVKFTAGHDDLRTQFYIESIEQSDAYLKEIHPAIEEIDIFNKEFITEQYTHYIEQCLKKMVKGNFSSLQGVLDAARNNVTQMMDPSKKNACVPVHSKLIARRELCEKLLPLIPYQNRVDNLKKQPKVDYTEKIFELSEEITKNIAQLESSDEFQAKLFLDKAEKYLRASNWDVGLQWKKHTIVVEGKEKKIPATVAAQLKVIEQARENGVYSYLQAKKDFLNIGKEKEISWRSSKVARSYYSLFKKPDDTTLEKDLNKTFSPTSKT
ncbi:hypothetical protein [Legionella bozemanae]|uniref:Substrate of the Dot/Icm secretion system n=1 Tax=Legionella bozemanae TaxID=447 RepID=A0A0W0S1G4_LEGBO|nr:hypothetical protein [Legionella bozemanae]KTC77222.1 substrate of the Dot/Icm secretion system [Legionella bozemanae]STO32835.1 Uncharacterised protein [Legionella bozemanae]